MPSSSAMSATAVLAYPTRRKCSSATSMMRERVSSCEGRALIFMAGVHPLTDECRNTNDDFRNLSLVTEVRKGLVAPAFGSALFQRAAAIHLDDCRSVLSFNDACENHCSGLLRCHDGQC